MRAPQGRERPALHSVALAEPMRGEHVRETASHGFRRTAGVH